MRKAGLILTVAAFIALSGMIVNVKGDAAKVSSYQFPNLVVEINRVVTILNSVLDSSNNIDASKVQGTYSDADGSITVSNLVLNGSAQVDTINEKGTSGVTVEGVSIDDGAIVDADGSLTISNIVANGSITLADTTAAGTVTPAATNAPALVSTVDAAYINVTIGGEVYVVTAYQLDD